MANCGSRWPIMELAFHLSITKKYSPHSSGCTARQRLAPELAWRSASASWNGTAAGSGWNPTPAKERRSFLRFPTLRSTPLRRIEMAGDGEPRKVHILLIEDNPGDVALIRMALRNAGLDCDLTVIDEGGDAMAFVQQQGKYGASRAPDLAILDLNLPKNDGLEILAAMRENQAFVEVPVAVLSSSSWPRDRTKLEVFNIARYITKPPDLDEFMRIGLILKELLAAG